MIRRRRGQAAAAAAAGAALMGATAGLLDVRILSVDASRFPELELKAEVIDRQGYTLRKLDTRHLALYEDDQLMKLKKVGLDPDPIHVVLALDASGTMVPASDQVKDTAANLLRLMDPDDYAAVLEVSSEPRMISRFGEPRSRAVQALHAVVPYGPTALYDGLYRSLLELGGRRGRRSIVVITDGRDQNKSGSGPGSRHTEEEVLELAKKMEVTIHAVALGKLALKKDLARMAAKSGGSAFYAPRPRHLEDLYGRILRRLKGRIRMVADTLRPELDATRRRLDLRVRAGQAFGEDQAGYVAPGRYVMEVGAVGWKRPSYEDVAARSVAVRGQDLEELAPASRDELLAWITKLFVVPSE
jgi:Mg-chelatase subunit ChlD